ncbi:MaoC family dehydratase N-terminal domain-containing protein [Streptomyces sp. NPDC005538]|uniref:FAS1-like dehydratase domain-containing protein n=1 Tax=unclassified Streptomyces TaxID=2593676 RepID=UPI0033BC0505
MIDASYAGTRVPPFTADVERGRLRQFAAAVGTVGSGDDVFHDVAAARAAGHPDLPVPPTFLFGLEMEHSQDLLTDMGVDVTRVLHIEQGFVYHGTAHAGDRLTFAPVIVSIRAHRGGSLELITKDTSVTRADGSPVADLHQVLAVRNTPDTRGSGGPA